MGFLETSAITSKVRLVDPASVGAAQVNLTNTVPSLPSSVSDALSGAVLGSKTALTALDTISKIPQNISGAISSVTKSVTSTFSELETSLAKGLDESLSGIFNNTNIPRASTTTTVIPDPVASSLLDSKTPLSSPFVLSSFQTGSQTLSMSGSSSKFGTTSETMVGTNLSTVMNRYNLDAISTLGTTVVSAKSTSTINSLFSNLATIPNKLNAVVSTTLGVVNKVSQTISATQASINNVVKSVENIKENVTSDFDTFRSKLSSLSNTLGNFDASGIFIDDGDKTLLDQNGTPVSTGGSGVSAATANAIVATANNSGCTVNTHYSSYKATASLYGTSLTLASKNRMVDLVGSLLGCATSATPLGQTALTNSFATAVKSSVEIADMIIDAIESYSHLNNPSITVPLVTNPELKPSDIGTVESILIKLGTTVEKVYSVPSVSSDAIPVTDINLVSATQPNFVKTIFGDDTFDTYLKGSVLSLNSSGQFEYA